MNVVIAGATRRCHTCRGKILAGERHVRTVCGGWNSSPQNTCIGCLRATVKEIDEANAKERR